MLHSILSDSQSTIKNRCSLVENWMKHFGVLCGSKIHDYFHWYVFVGCLKACTDFARCKAFINNSLTCYAYPIPVNYANIVIDQVLEGTSNRVISSTHEHPLTLQALPSRDIDDPKEADMPMWNMKIKDYNPRTWRQTMVLNQVEANASYFMRPPSSKLGGEELVATNKPDLKSW